MSDSKVCVPRDQFVQEEVRWLNKVREEEGDLAWANKVGCMLVENHRFLEAALVKGDEGMVDVSKRILFELRIALDEIKTEPTLNVAFVEGVITSTDAILAGE